jgi:heme-degrading monooxygenase HmoA
MSQNQATSYGRVVRLKGDPSKINEAVRLWTQDILPLLKKQPGFTGATLIGNRKTGNGLSVSYWESESAMKQARGQVRPEALKVMGQTGGSIVEEDECEVALLERIKPAKAGVWARITTVHGDPAHISEALSNFKEKIVPVIQKQSGARTALFFVNRQTGKTFGGSVWDTEQDLQNSEASIASLRAETIKKFGGKDAVTEVFEVYYTEILTPVASVRSVDSHRGRPPVAVAPPL